MSGAGDLNDPDMAMRLGQELASDLLRAVGAGLVAMPIEARLMFFQAYFAVLLGGCRAVVGEELTRSTFEHLERCLIDAPFEAKPRLH